jgi:hypothetical protein
MSDTQLLTIALAAAPTMLAVLVGILINNSRLGDLRAHVDTRFADVNRRFDAVDRRFDGVDRRFDEMRELWQSELHRVEEVLDARLKHLEERD